MFFFQAEDGIRDLVRSRGLGDVYKRQLQIHRAVPRRVDVRHVGGQDVVTLEVVVQRALQRSDGFEHARGRARPVPAQARCR